MEYAITAQGLSKLYPRDRGCKGIDLKVAKGRIFGLLGPNGAGKSTFIKMLLGLVHPTSGDAAILGEPIGDVSTRARIGFLPETFKYQEWLTGRELLNYHLALDNVAKNGRSKKISTALEIVGLSGAGDSKIRTYSKGMQQRLGIASALVGDPDLLFFDEPTSHTF